MKKSKRIALIVAAVLTAAGIVVSLIAITAANFDFSSMNTTDYSVVTHTADGAFKNISVNGGECNIKIALSDDGTDKVICRESNDVYNSVKNENGTLTIEHHNERKWYEYFGVDFSNNDIKIFLSQTSYKGLSIENASGAVKISEGFLFENADISTLSGSIVFEAAAENTLSIDTKSGGIRVGKAKPQRLKLKSVSGEIVAEEIDSDAVLDLETASGDIKLKAVDCKSISAVNSSGSTAFTNVIAVDSLCINSKSGSVKLDSCDSDLLNIKTVSGAVRGSLLTEKLFIVRTSSGSINVPQSANSEKCEVTTSSGDIDFVIK